jgi:hypothetical protein
LAVATVFGVIAWAWGILSWKLTGSPATARDIALGLFVLIAVLCYLGVQRKPSRALKFLAIALPIVVPTCGGCLTSVSDFNPGGGVNFALANNTPTNQSAGLATLLFGGMLVGLSAIWPLRRAARTDNGDDISRLVLLSGVWLLASLAVIFWLFRCVPLRIDRWLVPEAALGVVLTLLGVAMRRPRRWRTCAGLGVGVTVGALWIWIISGRSPVARCEREAGGLLVKWQTTAVTAYRAHGVELQQVVCKTTLQYSNEETRMTFGTVPDGSVLYGASLFTRVSGSPLERARAARDLLLVDDCDELALPDDSTVRALAPRIRVQAPVENDGKLIFYCLHHDYMYGRGTTVGMMIEPTRYEVDLHTTATSKQRLY